MTASACSEGGYSIAGREGALTETNEMVNIELAKLIKALDAVLVPHRRYDPPSHPVLSLPSWGVDEEGTKDAYMDEFFGVTSDGRIPFNGKDIVDICATRSFWEVCHKNIIVRRQSGHRDTVDAVADEKVRVRGTTWAVSGGAPRQ